MKRRPTTPQHDDTLVPYTTLFRSENTKKVLELAIQHGGSTIRTYEVVGGIHGNYQDFLNVHARKGKKCPNCETLIEKITVNGRGTYFCPKCQAK